MGGDGTGDVLVDQRGLAGVATATGDRFVDFFWRTRVGGSIAAFGAGAVRSASGSYLLAFLASGVACLAASMLVLRITPRGKMVMAAE